MFPFQISGNTVIKQFKLEWKADHFLKTIHGVCNKVQHQDLMLTKKGYHYLLEKPFLISVDVSSIKTGNKNRDSNLYDLLQYPRYKTIAIHVEDISYKETKTIIKGTIQIAGKTKPFLADATVKEGPGALSVNGESQILLSQFDIDAPSFLGMPVKDRIQIMFQYDLNLQ